MPNRRTRSISDASSVGNIWWRRVSMMDCAAAGSAMCILPCRRGCRERRARGEVWLSSQSHPEKLGVAGLDLLALGLDRRGIAADQLDGGEWRAPGLRLDLRVRRMAVRVDEDLLPVRRAQEGIEE